MPRTKPITRSSKKDPVEITLEYLKEHIKYLQRCLRRSENKNTLLEQELTSTLADISTQQEEYNRLSQLNSTHHGLVLHLLRRVKELEDKNKDLEEKVMKLRCSPTSSRFFTFEDDPWNKINCPPEDKDGFLIGYKYKLNPRWVRVNPGKDPGPRPLDYDEVVQQEQSKEGSNNNNNK